MDLKKIGERTIWIDCDVIQADGGTRTASITGSFVALVDALNWLCKKKEIEYIPINNFVSAVSVGIVDGIPILDLNYEEDYKAEVDMNIIMTDDNKFVEIQGTGEEYIFSREELNKLLDLAEKGNNELIIKQKEALEISVILCQRRKIKGEDYGKKKLILSTGNPDKVKEIKDILKDLPVDILSKKI